MLMSRHYVDFTISLHILSEALAAAGPEACTSKLCTAMSKLFVAVATAAALPASGNAAAVDTEIQGLKDPPRHPPTLHHQLWQKQN